MEEKDLLRLARGFDIEGRLCDVWTLKRTVAKSSGLSVPRSDHLDPDQLAALGQRCEDISACTPPTFWREWSRPSAESIHQATHGGIAAALHQYKSSFNVGDYKLINTKVV